MGDQHIHIEGIQKGRGIENFASHSASGESITLQGHIQEEASMTQQRRHQRTERDMPDQTDRELEIAPGPAPNSTGCPTCSARQNKDNALRARSVSFNRIDNVSDPTAAYSKPEAKPSSMRRGNVYRIWKPNDVVMHRSTVIVMLDNGRSWSACKIEKKENVPSDMDNMEHYWAKVHVHTSTAVCHKVHYDADQPELHELTLYPDQGQTLASECMVELERLYDVGREDEYEVIYCGKLDAKSFEYARKKHLELYGAG